MANIAARDPVDVGLRRARWIADLAARLNDPDTSTAVLRQIVEAVENGQLDWNETVEYALDKVREKRAAGELQKSPGAYFVGLLRRRGLSLKPKGATRRPA